MTDIAPRLLSIKTRLESISPREAASIYGTPARLLNEDLPWLVTTASELAAANEALRAAAASEVTHKASLSAEKLSLEARVSRLERIMVEPGEPDKPE